MKGILKWPLIIAAVAVVLRVVVERAGAPESITNLISVVALHFVIVPIYFAIRIARSGVAHPYLTQLKLTVLYVVITRAMVLPTYWLAHIFQWPQSRFGGLGPDATPFTAYITIPFGTAAMWIMLSTILGGILGSLIIFVYRLVNRTPAAESKGVSAD